MKPGSFVVWKVVGEDGNVFHRPGMIIEVGEDPDSVLVGFEVEKDGEKVVKEKWVSKANLSVREGNKDPRRMSIDLTKLEAL